MRPDAADERPRDPVQAWTAERERVHRERAARLVLPFIPPLVVLLLVIGGVLPMPRDLPAIALWLILIALYAGLWMLLVRDARRLAHEAAAVDLRFPDVTGGGAPIDARVAVPRLAERHGGDGGDDGALGAGPVIALVGRPIDERDAVVTRFPLAAVADVRAQLDRYMARVRPSAVICSAACGADLLALDVAEARRVRRRIVLPYERSRFRHDAVTNRPGTWGPLFDRILGALPSQDVIVVGDRGEGHTSHAVSEGLSAAILDQARVVAAAAASTSRGVSGAGDAPLSPSRSSPRGREERNVIAVIVWERRSSPVTPSLADPIAAFRTEAERRGIRVDEIPTV